MNADTAWLVIRALLPARPAQVLGASRKVSPTSQADKLSVWRCLILRSPSSSSASVVQRNGNGGSKDWSVVRSTWRALHAQSRNAGLADNHVASLTIPEASASHFLVGAVDHGRFVRTSWRPFEPASGTETRDDFVKVPESQWNKRLSLRRERISSTQ